MCVTCLTEAESELGNQQEVVHLSTNSSPVVGSSSDCHTELMDSEDCIEKASPHMADSDMVCVVKVKHDSSPTHGHLFSSNRVSMKKHVGMHLVCHYPYLSCVLFDLTVPSLLTSGIFSCFLYLLVSLFWF